jgi:hypothetical protein
MFIKISCLIHSNPYYPSPSVLPARRHPTPSQGLMPGGGPQSAVEGEDEARELPARRHLCSKPPVAEARAWVGIGLGRTRRRGGGRSSGARARLVVEAAGGR